MLLEGPRLLSLSATAFGLVTRSQTPSYARESISPDKMAGVLSDFKQLPEIHSRVC